MIPGRVERVTSEDQQPVLSPRPVSRTEQPIDANRQAGQQDKSG